MHAAGKTLADFGLFRGIGVRGTIALREIWEDIIRLRKFKGAADDILVSRLNQFEHLDTKGINYFFHLALQLRLKIRALFPKIFSYGAGVLLEHILNKNRFRFYSGLICKILILLF